MLCVRKAASAIGTIGPGGTIIHVGQPGFFSLGYTLCGRKVSRRIDSSPLSEATCRDCKRRWELATGTTTKQ